MVIKLVQKEKYDFLGEISVSDRNVKSKKYSVCQINMDPKNNSSVIHIRNLCLSLLRIKTLQTRTQNAHPITIYCLKLLIGCVTFCVGC